MKIKIGAHMSAAGGYHKALERISAIGGNTLQLFSGSPRGWNNAKVSNEQIVKFVQTKKRLDIDPVYFHASYLINLADEDRIGHLSVQSLVAELTAASQLGIRGSIIHLGSFKDNGQELDVSKNRLYSALITHILEILAATPKDTLFIIENAGNRKIGQTLDQIAAIHKDVNDERVRICLDTCHLYSTGYDLRTQKGLDVFLAEFDKMIGIPYLDLWHLNDSRDPLGSFRDRHENIGSGTIGLSEFNNVIRHPILKHLPFIIETPGFDGGGPDKKNIDIIKTLI